MSSNSSSNTAGKDHKIGRRELMTVAGSIGTVALAGCSSDGNAGAETDASAGSDSVEVLTTYTSTASKASYQSATTKYNNEYPDRNVQMNYSSWNDIFESLQQAASTGNWPDLTIFLDNELNLLLYDQDLVADPEKLMNATDEAVGPIGDDVPETHYLQKDGSFYTMQSNNQTPTFWYRTDVAEDIGMEAPETWNEELRFMQQANEADNDLYGTIVSTKLDNYTNTLIFARYRGAGGTILDPEGNVVVDNQITRDTLEHWNEMVEYSPPGVEGFSYGDIYGSFASDRTASCQYWGRTLINVIEQTPEVADDVNNAHLPQPETSEASPDSISLMTGDGGQMTREANEEAALDWWKTYIQPESFVNEFMTGTPGNAMPIWTGHREAFDNLDVWSQVEHGDDIRETLYADARSSHPKCRAGPDYPAFPELTQIYRNQIFSTPGSDYFAGNIDAEEATNEMEKIAEQQKDQYS